MEIWSISPCILNLGAKMELICIFRTPLPCCRSKRPREVLDRRLDGLPIRTGSCWKYEEPVFPCWESNTVPSYSSPDSSHRNDKLLLLLT